MQRLLSIRPVSRLLLDGAIAGLALAGTLAVLTHGVTIPGSAHGTGRIDAVGAMLAACGSVPLLAWRRGPLAVFAVTASAYTLLGALGYAVGVPIGATVALYLLAASRDDEDPWTRRTTAAVLVLFGAYLGATAVEQGGFPGRDLFHTSLAWGAAWFAGERTRLQREHIAELGERAVRAETEAERERRLAVAEERARIARDLHDSAGHAINVIAVRAGAARMGHARDPDRSRAALAAIEQLARDTVGEVDTIVGTLRDDRSPAGPAEAPPGLASIDTLVAHHTSAGVDVQLRTCGTRRALTATTDRAAFRILQEALTNASRHGAGTATIDLAFGDSALDITVVNPVPGDVAAAPGGGHGLVGMRERATMAGGSLDAGRVDGTFRVRARLPYDRRAR